MTRQIDHDLDRAELERCDVFSDYAASEDRAYFEIPDDRWQAMLADWRRRNPDEAAQVDRALGVAGAGKSDDFW